MITAIPELERAIQSVPAFQPAADMGDLASLLRSFLRVVADRKVPLGGHLFDAVVTGAGLPAWRAVEMMDQVQGGCCGPVIEDPERGWLYWLVPPGTAGPTGHRRIGAYGVCFGATHHLTLPALDQRTPPGPYWLRPATNDRRVPPKPLLQTLEQYRPMPTPHADLAALLGITC